VSEGGAGFGRRRRRDTSKLLQLWGKKWWLVTVLSFSWWWGRITGSRVTETIEEPEGPGALALRTRDVVFTLAAAVGHSGTGEVGEDIAIADDEGGWCTRGRSRSLGIARRSFF
jgi:hypothetical protein